MTDVMMTSEQTTPVFLQRLWGRYLAWRGGMVNRLLTFMYGHPMQVLPKGHVGLAGGVVFWYLQDGFKQFVMVRGNDGDGRARFVSCLGLGKHPDLGGALRAVVELQLGKVFARSLGAKLFEADRVAAAPLFTYADEALGTSCPVQALVWVVQVQPAQVDLIETQSSDVPGSVQAVMVPEFALSSQKVSNTHRSLWHAVQRHIPKGKLAREGVVLDEAAADEAINEVSSGGRGSRVLH